MKLLIYSHFFAPSVGGVETLVLSLARGLAGLRTPGGEPEFDITVGTQTAADTFDDSSLPFRVNRRPSLIHLWDLIHASEVVHVAGPALAPILLGLMARKPVVVEHHGFQTICPNGQLLIEPAGNPCPGHFMAGRHGECFRCNSGQGWIVSLRLWLLTFVRRILVQAGSGQHYADGRGSGAWCNFREASQFLMDWKATLRRSSHALPSAHPARDRISRPAGDNERCRHIVRSRAPLARAESRHSICSIRRRPGAGFTGAPFASSAARGARSIRRASR